MSYSGASNPPWQRNTLANAGNQSQMQNPGGPMPGGNPGIHYGNQSMYGQNIGMAQQQNQNMGVGGPYNMNQMGPGTGASMFPPVSYPTPASHGNLNPVAFGGAGQQSGPQQQQQLQSNNYNAVGVVTKVHNDCGFVDDEVFFHKNVCKGHVPKVGDRVLVEASFNQNSPFKWNATRVQLVSAAASGGSGSGGSSNAIQRAPPPPLLGSGGSSSSTKGGSGYNAVPPPNEYAGQFGRSSRRASPPPPPRRGGGVSPPRSSSRKDPKHGRDEDEYERKRRREERELRERERERAERDRERERRAEKRTASPEKRERSPRRRLSPKRRRTQISAIVPRYMVQIPKINLTITKADVLELRHRYMHMYVPSDFFQSKIKWGEAFPANSPFSIQRPCQFHIMHKSIEPPRDMIFAADPADADYLFSAKVMLMGVPSMTEIFQKCLMEDREHDDDRDFIHPTRLINFLVGVRGKNETMAVGGAWSPTLDGPNPESDPSVLIKTAIRTCNYLTGIDLSGCTQWYRFVEIYYRRAETVHKGKLIPARVETVVIFLPDINSCIPTRSEWDGLQQTYKTTLEHVLHQAENPTDDAVIEVDDDENADAADSAATATLETSSASTADGRTDGTTNRAKESKDAAASDGRNGNSGSNQAAKEKSTGATDESGNEKNENKGKLEPTHYSELDPKTMKIQQLRDELEARNLSAKGLKPQLIARLAKILNAERLQEESKADEEEDEDMEKSEENADGDNGDDNEGFDDLTGVDMSDIVVLDEYDSTKPDDAQSNKKDQTKVLGERERHQLERRYRLPDSPHIIVHPSKTAKSGKFDCTVQSLSLLLDYRPEDTKEHSFEVALFAELFNEMLMRDFGFNIYKEIAILPEKPKEKDEPEKKKKEEASNDKPTAAAAATNDTDKEKESTNDKSTTSKETTAEVKQRETNTSSEKGSKDRKANNENEKADKKTSSSSSIKDRRTSIKRGRGDDESDNDQHSTRSTTDRRRHTVVAKPDLLLSFVYFDTTHCGYIFEKDLEDLFHIIGLNLSRAQIRKILSKVISREAFYYRKLTDKPKEVTSDKVKEEAGGAGDESAKTAVKAESEIKNDFDFSLLAKGNRALLPIFKNLEKFENAVSMNEDGGKTMTTKTGMVYFNGSLIDINKLVEQMKRAERGREEAEDILTELRRQNAELQTSQTKSGNRIKDLQADVKSLSRRLTDTEQSLSSITRKNNDYYNTLSSIYDRVVPIFNRKSDIREKDRDKDREKDKERERSEKSDRKDRSGDKDNKDDASNKHSSSVKESKEAKGEEKKSIADEVEKKADNSQKQDKSDESNVEVIVVKESADSEDANDLKDSTNDEKVTVTAAAVEKKVGKAGK